MTSAASGLARRCTGCGRPLSRYNSLDLCQGCVSAGRKSDFGQPAGDRAPLVDGARLAQLRRDRGWTQDVLADFAGISSELVRKLEQGARRSARISTLSALARALNVPVSVLLGDSPAGVPAHVSGSQSETATQPEHAAEPVRMTLLRVLATERQWHRFKTFEAQFQRAARALAKRDSDPDLAKLTISSRQWERWNAGNVKTEPHPDAARVLEHMFGYPVQQLLATGKFSRSTPMTSAGNGRIALQNHAHALRFTPIGGGSLHDTDVAAMHAFRMADLQAGGGHLYASVVR